MVVRERTGPAPRTVSDSPPGLTAAKPIELADLVTLASRIQVSCVARAHTLATAESCTGGLLSHVLTEVAGSSSYFRGGAISYSDALKRQVLGVPPGAIEAHGAVSAQVAVAMANGARKAFQADISVATTGIAGPGGGSDRKPVGLTYICVADAEGQTVKRFQWSGGRSDNKLASTYAALELVIERLGTA